MTLSDLRLQFNAFQCERTSALKWWRSISQGEREGVWMSREWSRIIAYSTFANSDSMIHRMWVDRGKPNV